KNQDVRVWLGRGIAEACGVIHKRSGYSISDSFRPDRAVVLQDRRVVLKKIGTGVITGVVIEVFALAACDRSQKIRHELVGCSNHTFVVPAGIRIRKKALAPGDKIGIDALIES